MKATTTLSGLVASAVLAVSMIAPGTASAASKPNPACKKAEKQLTAKIKRLKRMAAERRSKGDAYGERRLKSLANVIAAHRGNLPCVNKQTCGI
ncbi:hypothetical protein [Thiofilum flexile]|uniref:hypothetical protein n=1 Tax=Thiofilum flexile TaxID=125627 RepID=UPI0003651199|nr:hypothetical protein [Thiofilum flexile]